MIPEHPCPLLLPLAPPLATIELTSTEVIAVSTSGSVHTSNTNILAIVQPSVSSTPSTPTVLAITQSSQINVLEMGKGASGTNGTNGTNGLDAEDIGMKYRKLVDEVLDTPSSGDTTYYTGWSDPGAGTGAAAVWRIRKMVLDSNGDVTESGFSDGDLLFDNIWNSRLGLGYS